MSFSRCEQARPKASTSDGIPKQKWNTGSPTNSRRVLSLENHYFYNKGVNGARDALDNTNGFRFGGVALAGKYRG